MVHELKTWPIFFRLIRSGEKTFEYRINDRNFREGDVLQLREYDPLTDTYTGEGLFANVGFVLYVKCACSKNQVSEYAIMSLLDLSANP